MIFCVCVDYSCVLERKQTAHKERCYWECRKENKSDVFMLLSLWHLQIGSDADFGSTLPGYRGSCLLLRPLPGIYSSDTHVRHMLWLPSLTAWTSKARMWLCWDIFTALSASYLSRGGAMWLQVWRSMRTHRPCCWNEWGGGWPRPDLDTDPTSEPVRSESWQRMCDWCDMQPLPPSWRSKSKVKNVIFIIQFILYKKYCIL